MKILLVEDEDALRESIIDYLGTHGFLCEYSSCYKDAADKVFLNNYDCIIVDIMLPDGSGLQLIEDLKKTEKNCGIIIISAKGSLEDRISGLDSGSDDYITKPFHLSELNARVRSVIRRRNFNGDTIIKFQELSVNPASRQVFVDGQLISLTAKEFELLLFFMANKEKVIPKDSLAEHLWGSNMDQADSFDFIYTHIKNMRKKLIQAGGGDYLKSVYGIGYKFTAG